MKAAQIKKAGQNQEAEKKVLEKDISALENRISSLKTEYQNKKKRADELAKIINNYRITLGIKDNQVLDMISDYYRTIQDKKSRFNLLKNDEKKLSYKKNEINKELQQILKAVRSTAVLAGEDVYHLKFEKEEDISLIEYYRELFIEFDKAVEFLEVVKELKELNDQLNNLNKETQILSKRTGFTINEDPVLTLQEFIKESEIFKEYIELEKEHKEALYFGKNY